MKRPKFAHRSGRRAADAETAEPFDTAEEARRHAPPLS